MTKTFRLVTNSFNALCFPHGGIADDDGTVTPAEDVPSMLIRVYPAGDCDVIKFPFAAGREAELRKLLARALFDERETNDFFPSDAVIELPDGSRFDFDSLVD